jgi:hypothetical protein
MTGNGITQLDILCMDVLGLVSGLPKCGQLGWRRVALQAWIDDSGKGQPPVYLLAGYLGAPSQWAAFSHDWDEMLQGPPKLDYMKSTEASRLKGQFLDWPASERDKRQLAAVSIIKKHGVIGVKVGIKHDDFRKILKINRPGLRAPHEPMMAHMMITVLGLIEYLPPLSRNQAKIEFLFDCGTVSRKELETCYKALVRGNPEFQRFFYNEPSFRTIKFSSRFRLLTYMLGIFGALMRLKPCKGLSTPKCG